MKFVGAQKRLKQLPKADNQMQKMFKGFCLVGVYTSLPTPLYL